MRPFAVAVLAASVLAAADRDGDGLDDALEQLLLEAFAPRFHLAPGECDGLPARFAPDEPHPRALARDGTIYGQASPRPDGGIELRYFHLWTRDCGRLAHALDAERVSALLVRDRGGGWRAAAWFAAAHEGTACDASSLARAADLDAETRGPQVWISRGKHASFLSRRACRGGCGGDTCGEAPMMIARLLNLGEPDRPLDGARWVTSNRWQMASKMSGDFGEERMAKLGDPGRSGVRTLHADLRTAQSLILGGNATGDALAVAGAETDRALTASAGRLEQSLGKAGESTAAAVAVSARKTGRALRDSARSAREAIRSGLPGGSSSPRPGGGGFHFHRH